MSLRVIAENLVFGTLHLKGLSKQESYTLLDYFFSVGGLWVDTAYLYGNGVIESLLGQYIKNNKLTRCSIVTKVGYFNHVEDFKYFSCIRNHILYSIERLQCVPNYILLHEADWNIWWCQTFDRGGLLFPRMMRHANFDIFSQCIELGKEYGFEMGLSGNNAHVLNLILSRIRPALILVAKQFDLVWNSISSLMKTAKKLQLPVWFGAPFHQGWLYRLNELAVKVPILSNRITRLEKILYEENLKVEQLAISYLLQQTHYKTKIVFGVKSKAELKKIVNNVNFFIDEVIIEKIKSIAIDYPPMVGPIR